MANKIHPKDGLEHMGEDIRKFFHGWKIFTLKDNVLFVAFGLITATLFNNIISSFINDILMPLFNYTFGIKLENLFVVLINGTKNINNYSSLDNAKNDDAVTFNYGSFINDCLYLLIVSFVLYLLYKLSKIIQRLDKSKKKKLFLKNHQND